MPVSYTHLDVYKRQHINNKTIVSIHALLAEGDSHLRNHLSLSLIHILLDVECSEWKMQGRRIHASCAPLPLSYIADIENADQFDPRCV